MRPDAQQSPFGRDGQGLGTGEEAGRTISWLAVCAGSRGSGVWLLSMFIPTGTGQPRGNALGRPDTAPGERGWARISRAAERACRSCTRCLGRFVFVRTYLPTVGKAVPTGGVVYSKNSAPREPNDMISKSRGQRPQDMSIEN